MKTKLFGITPTKNEAPRYLTSMLEETVKIVDELFVYDDQSDDETVSIVSKHTPNWWVRDNEVSSFLEHEGRFRQDMWDNFESLCNPKVGDWVLAIDADELLTTTGDNCCVRCEVDKAIEFAVIQGAESVLLPVPEVFGFADDGHPLVRKDGLWNTIAGTRLFRYKRGGSYRNRPMGCGAEPDYVSKSKISRQSLGLHLMHFGYAYEPDQLAKYQRYTSLQTHGHLDAHVQSIIGPKKLERWNGPTVSLRRGQ